VRFSVIHPLIARAWLKLSAGAITFIAGDGNSGKGRYLILSGCFTIHAYSSSMDGCRRLLKSLISQVDSMNDKEIDSLKQNKTTPGVARWYAALTNSINGLKFGLKNEAAMREEIILLLAAIPLSIYLVESIWLRLAMVLSILFVLIVEVLNSALEATLDRVSEEYHQLTKAAKDLGSLAVLLAMMLAISIWVVAIFSE